MPHQYTGDEQRQQQRTPRPGALDAVTRAHAGALLDRSQVRRRRCFPQWNGGHHARFPLDRFDEPVAVAWNRLDEARALGRVAKRLAKLADCGVQTVIEDDEGVCGPEVLTQFLASNDDAAPVQQQDEGFERFVLQANTSAVLSELTRAQVQLENTEADDGVAGVEAWHGARRAEYSTGVAGQTEPEGLCQVAVEGSGRSQRGFIAIS